MTKLEEREHLSNKQPKSVLPICVRQGAFDFPKDTKAHWIPSKPELAQMINGASFVMPHLEPFLVASLGEAGHLIADVNIKREARDFCMQETQHYRTHRRFNDVIIENGYPNMVSLEKEMAQSYARLMRRPLATRLAYAAGFEAMTLGITGWLVSQRRHLFKDADPYVTSFILWHMVEETEHKLVAHDVYCAVTPGYWRRALGVLHGSADVIRWTRRSYINLLRHDGRWNSARGRLRVWLWAARALIGVAPALLKALVPGHDPRSMVNHEWVDQWIAGYANMPKNDRKFMPLIDTASPAMPVPF